MTTVFFGKDVYKRQGKEFERFRQIVLIGKRTRSRNGAREAVRLYKQCELGPDLPGLSEIGTARYTIPNTCLLYTSPGSYDN